MFQANAHLSSLFSGSRTKRGSNKDSTINGVDKPMPNITLNGTNSKGHLAYRLHKPGSDNHCSRTRQCGDQRRSRAAQEVLFSSQRGQYRSLGGRGSSNKDKQNFKGGSNTSQDGKHNSQGHEYSSKEGHQNFNGGQDRQRRSVCKCCLMWFMFNRHFAYIHLPYQRGIDNQAT